MKMNIARLFLDGASHNPIASSIHLKELWFVPSHCNNHYFYVSIYSFYFRF